MAPAITSLADGAAAIVAACSSEEKVSLSASISGQWSARRLSRVTSSTMVAVADRPGRPDHPVLLAPRDMPKRSAKGERGRIAMLHALAHIELNAIDLAWDVVARFAGLHLPRSFFDDWVRVGADEARHFSLLRRRLRDFGCDYGSMPAHDGLWEAAHETGYDLTARLAIIPLVLEARGLDVTPPMVAKFKAAGDDQTADILKTVYTDEKRHVATGIRWFRFMCDRNRLDPQKTFHELVRRHFRGALKPPFNDSARAQAGLNPTFYKPLSGLTA